MAYTMTVTFTRPSASIPWWYEANPEAGRRLNDFCAGFAGVISMSVGVQNATTNQSITVFVDQAAQQALAAACATNADWLARAQYMKENGINVVINA